MGVTTLPGMGWVQAWLPTGGQDYSSSTLKEKQISGWTQWEGAFQQGKQRVQRFRGITQHEDSENSLQAVCCGWGMTWEGGGMMKPEKLAEGGEGAGTRSQRALCAMLTLGKVCRLKL